MKFKIKAENEKGTKALQDLLADKSFKIRAATRKKKIRDEPLVVLLTPRGLSKFPSAIAEQPQFKNTIKTAIEQIFSDYALKLGKDITYTVI